jgi:hypothetical protein
MVCEKQLIIEKLKNNNRNTFFIIFNLGHKGNNIFGISKKMFFFKILTIYIKRFMSKKIVRLTESQLKLMINKVIKEQTAPVAKPAAPQQTPDEQLFKDQQGKVYRLPLIKSNEDINKFINFQTGSRPEVVLKSMGLDLTGLAQEANAQMQKDPTKPNNFKYILGSIWAFLDVAAQYNLPSKAIKGMSARLLQKMDERDINKDYTNTLHRLFNVEVLNITMDQYWVSLSKLLDYQKGKMTNG